MSEKEEETGNSSQGSQPLVEAQDDPWAILGEEIERKSSIPETLKVGITKSPILSRLEEKRQKQLDEELGDDPLVKMSRQVSSMSKEIETLRLNLYDTTEQLKLREMELYNLRKKNFVKSNLFTNFVINNDPRRRAFFFWKNHTEEVRKEQEDLQNRLQSLVGHHLEESNKNQLMFSQSENDKLERHLMFAKIFFRWRMNLECHSRTLAERQYMKERVQIMNHLREVREQMTMANDLEATYVHMALRRGKEMFDGIKEAYEQALETKKWEEEYARKILSGEIDPRQELKAAMEKDGLNTEMPGINSTSDPPQTTQSQTEDTEEIEIDLSSA